MVNFHPLATEIGSLVWGTLANFNWFRVLVALLCGTSSGRQPNFAALNGGRHLYLAGRPSLWALAHIIVTVDFLVHYLTWVSVMRAVMVVRISSSS